MIINLWIYLIWSVDRIKSYPYFLVRLLVFFVMIKIAVFRSLSLSYFKLVNNLSEHDFWSSSKVYLIVICIY